MKRTVLVVALLCLLAAPSGATSQTLLTAGQLREDFAILKKAYTELHPGLNRYVDQAAVARNFDELERDLQRDMTQAEAYLTFSRFLGKIRCGHTYANFWNQTDEVKRDLFGRADKVPFTFRLIDRRMIVTENASEEARIQRGTEILAINGVSVRRILDSLVPLVKGDGSNDAKRLHDLQITGVGEFEAFDVYYPLVYPPAEGKFKLKTPKFTATVPAVTRSRRAEVLKIDKVSYDDLWRFTILDGKTAHLRIGTFVTWNMKMDWKAFLQNSFQEIRQKNINHLILDIRGNEGGSDDVITELLRHLAWKPVEPTAWQERLRYVKVPPELDPYLSTWDKSFRNREGKVKDLGNGFYTWKEEEANAGIAASESAYRGKVYLLVDAANSSATFLLASILKNNQLATLVGQPTGGNRKGTNGGQMFFLTLPNSKIEMDIPLIGYYPANEQPDEGLRPDVEVKPSVEDVVKGIDTELEAVRKMIAG